MLARIADAIGRGDIDFEFHEFSEKYDVRGEDKKFAYDFCNARMIEYLLKRKAEPIEVENSSLATLFASQLNEAAIKSNLEHVLKLRKRMPAYLFAS